MTEAIESGVAHAAKDPPRAPLLLLSKLLLPYAAAAAAALLTKGVPAKAWGRAAPGAAEGQRSLPARLRTLRGLLLLLLRMGTISSAAFLATLESLNFVSRPATWDFSDVPSCAAPAAAGPPRRPSPCQPEWRASSLAACRALRPRGAAGALGRVGRALRGALPHWNCWRRGASTALSARVSRALATAEST
jgi:hypothetical protein